LDKLISIVIPSYEAKGKGCFFLKRCLNSIASQSYKNYEVIISDHSNDTKIEEEAATFSNMRIKHFYNLRGRGNSSINMNEGIKKACGDVIKVLHLDDQFCNDEALSKLNDLFKNQDTKWGAFGFDHIKENVIIRPVVPNMEETMGCPSTSFFLNDDNYFNESLIIINDHEMHHRLSLKYGKPSVIEDICVRIGVHDDQVTHADGSKEKEALEWEYFNKTYKQ
jgi:glycosyltransferase involved in cell wall biosynthesis